MTAYIIRRLIQAVIILFFLSIVFFFLVNLAPGGPLAGHGQSRHIRPEKAEILKRQFGLDKPLPVQYVVWLVGNDWQRVDADGDGVADSYGTRQGILRGDFGFSFRTRQPVMDEIRPRFRNTAYLMTITLLVVALIAIPVGVFSAIRQYSIFDLIVTTFTFIGQAIPEFWLGLILIMVFYGWLNNPFTGQPLLPSGGMYSLDAGALGFWQTVGDMARHLILPVTMGAVGWVAWYSRFLRSGMLEVIQQDYVRAARAKGASESRVLFRHALKNAILPVVTLFALDIPYIFAGSLYVEWLFAWPGMGRLYYQAAVDRDYPLLMTILIFGTLFVLVANILADIAYAYLDPRIHYE